MPYLGTSPSAAASGNISASATVGDGTAEDTKIVFDGNALDFRIGIDDGTDTLEIGKGNAHGTTSHVTIDTNGIMTKPLQPSFHAYVGTTQNNIATGSDLTINYDTEVWDLNADFDTSNKTFTAPVTGKYMLNVNLRMDNVDRDHVYLYMILKTSNREYEWLQDISVLYGDDPDYLPFTINVLADMDASDTAYVRMHIPNLGAAISDVVGSSKSTFSGYLAC